MNMTTPSSPPPRRIRPRTTTAACPSPSPCGLDRGRGRGGLGAATASRSAAMAGAIAFVFLLRSSSSSSSALFVPPRPIATTGTRWRREGGGHNDPLAMRIMTPSSRSAAEDGCADASSSSHGVEEGASSSPSSSSRHHHHHHHHYGLLTREEEISLLERMREYPPRTPTSQDDARQALLLHNLPLVKSIVTEVRRSRSTLSYASVPSHGSSSISEENGALTSDDLLHEGTIGLAEAIDRHDPRHETRLSTYATYWIRARVIRALQSRGEHALLRFPEHALQASHRLVKAAREMGLDWDDVVDMSTVDDEYVGDRTRELRMRLCEKAGISLSSGSRLFVDAVRVRSMSRYGTTTAPLESWMRSSSSYASAVADGGNDDIDIDGVGLLDGSTGGGQEHIVETLSRFLMPREVEVLSLRYGLVPSSSSSLGGEEDKDEGRTESSAASSSPMTTLTTTMGHRRPALRDYEAEAEEGLFGPNGMLSHYASTPNENGIAPKLGVATASSATAAELNGNDRRFPSTAAAATAASAAAVSSAQSLSSMTTSASRKPKETMMATSSLLPSTNSLLPFKEIGKRMKFSGEYCRRTCSVALNKLSRAAEEGRLAESDFLLGW